MSFDRSLSSARAEQAMAALATANRVKALRAELARDWKAKGRSDACLDAARMLAEPPRYMQTWRVELMLGRIPSIGELRLYHSGHHRSGEKIRKWMHELRIPLGTIVGTLTPRQRTALVERLRAYSDPEGWTADLLRRRTGK